MIYQLLYILSKKKKSTIIYGLALPIATLHFELSHRYIIVFVGEIIPGNIALVH
jgi:hypothetical protein